MKTPGVDPDNTGTLCDYVLSLAQLRTHSSWVTLVTTETGHAVWHPGTEHGGHAFPAGLCAFHMASMSSSRIAVRILVRALSE